MVCCPGPVRATSEGWTSIVDDDFSYSFLAVREFGAGRVAAVGHENFFASSALDTPQLQANLFLWLAGGPPASVAIASGHTEWFNYNNSSSLRATLGSSGFTAVNLSGNITASSLASRSVVVIGNAWSSFTSSELRALEEFVSNGGGLFLAGLGWSWQGASEDYPMRRIGESFGIDWGGGFIATDAQADGGPIMTRFYPDTDTLDPLVVNAQDVQTFRGDGDSANRVEIVILGDGYTAAESEKFAADARTVADGMLLQTPYLEYERFFKVHSVFGASAESGADQPDAEPPVRRDTAFHAGYKCRSLLCADQLLVQEAAASVLPPSARDILLLLVNEERGGGSGGSIAVASTGLDVVNVALHEIGHSLALLADEYSGAGSGCENGVEPAAVNVTKQTDRRLIKWAAWIAQARPFRRSKRGLLCQGYMKAPATVSRVYTGRHSIRRCGLWTLRSSRSTPSSTSSVSTILSLRSTPSNRRTPP